MTNTDTKRKWNPTVEEKEFISRIQPHFKRGMQGYLIASALAGIVLIIGNYLSGHIDVSPQSIPFQLWPFNKVYLRQFGAAPYCASDIRWFYTVISCSNLIWLVFLGWKFVFELLRRDVSFPAVETPLLYQIIIRVTAVTAGLIAVGYFDSSDGFAILKNTLLNPSFKQSITTGAIKIMLLMSILYVATGYFLEFGGLGVRYFLAKRFGYFSASPSAAKCAPSSARSRLSNGT